MKAPITSTVPGPAALGGHGHAEPSEQGSVLLNAFEVDVAFSRSPNERASYGRQSGRPSGAGARRAGVGSGPRVEERDKRAGRPRPAVPVPT